MSRQVRKGKALQEEGRARPEAPAGKNEVRSGAFKHLRTTGTLQSRRGVRSRGTWLRLDPPGFSVPNAVK